MQERKLAPYWRPDLGEHWNHQPKRMNLTIAPNSVFNYLWLALNTKLPIVSLGTQQILKWCPIWRYTFCQRCSDQFLPIGKHGCVWPVIKHKFRVPAKVRYINFNTLMKLKFCIKYFHWRKKHKWHSQQHHHPYCTYYCHFQHYSPHLLSALANTLFTSLTYLEKLCEHKETNFKYRKNAKLKRYCCISKHNKHNAPVIDPRKNLASLHLRFQCASFWKYSSHFEFYCSKYTVAIMGCSGEN